MENLSLLLLSDKNAVTDFNAGLTLFYYVRSLPAHYSLIHFRQLFFLCC